MIKKIQARHWHQHKDLWLPRRGVAYRVYRVENKDGIGPWRQDPHTYKTGKYWVKQSRKRPLLYLRPDQDFNMFHLMNLGFYKPMEHRPNFLFGFSNIKQIWKWLNKEELATLKEMGYSVVRRDAAMVLHSENQCIFVPHKDVQWK
jgi:hypothetical protein